MGEGGVRWGEDGWGPGRVGLELLHVFLLIFVFAVPLLSAYIACCSFARVWNVDPIELAEAQGGWEEPGMSSDLSSEALQLGRTRRFLFKAGKDRQRRG